MCTARPAAARALDIAALMAAIEAVGFSGRESVLEPQERPGGFRDRLLSQLHGLNKSQRNGRGGLIPGTG